MLKMIKYLSLKLLEWWKMVFLKYVSKAFGLPTLSASMEIMLKSSFEVF
ncbi:MAG: hypothetical protein ACP5K8_05275 [Nitrososphaeria archaeon]